MEVGASTSPYTGTLCGRSHRWFWGPCLPSIENIKAPLIGDIAWIRCVQGRNIQGANQHGNRVERPRRDVNRAQSATWMLDEIDHRPFERHLNSRSHLRTDAEAVARSDGPGEHLCDVDRFRRCVTCYGRRNARQNRCDRSVMRAPTRVSNLEHGKPCTRRGGKVMVSISIHVISTARKPY